LHKPPRSVIDIREMPTEIGKISLSTRSIPEPVIIKHFPLAAVLWPRRADGFSPTLSAVILIALGTALLTLSAKVNLPLPYVPMTLQTLVVLMIGAAYGWRLGSATVIAYLAEGANGFPVFAGPAGGLAPLFGPTGGYLVGFVLAAFATGWSAAGIDRCRGFSWRWRLATSSFSPPDLPGWRSA
jgi:biotin transport system substrate-specific component